MIDSPQLRLYDAAKAFIEFIDSERGDAIRAELNRQQSAHLLANLAEAVDIADTAIAEARAEASS